MIIKVPQSKICLSVYGLKAMITIGTPDTIPAISKVMTGGPRKPGRKTIGIGQVNNGPKTQHTAKRRKHRRPNLKVLRSTTARGKAVVKDGESLEKEAIPAATSVAPSFIGKMIVL